MLVIVTKGDRRKVVSSQQLKLQRKIVTGNRLAQHYTILGRKLEQGFIEGGEQGISLVIDIAARDMHDILIEENSVTAGELGDLTMRQLATKNWNPRTRLKQFEDEIILQISDYLAVNAARSTLFTTDTDRTISNSIVRRGLTAGSTINEIAKDLRTQFQGLLGKTRSATIANTEVGIAGSRGQFQGAVNLEANRKQWIQLDNRTARPIHDAIDNQIIGMIDMFFPGGEAMEHPHDTRTASAKNIVNCNCDMVFTR